MEIDADKSLEKGIGINKIIFENKKLTIIMRLKNYLKTKPRRY
jgi:hypothetical protein